MPNPYELDNKAQIYAKHGIQGTLQLAYREFPKLFEKYVDDSRVALDYGCGSGRSSRYLADIGFKVDAVDINDAMLEEAKQATADNQTINYQKIESGIIGQRKSKYDLIFSTLVFIEFPTLAEMKKIVDDIYRVAKFNGTLIILTVADDFYEHDWVSVNTKLPENADIAPGKPVYIELPEVGNLKLQDYYWRDQDYRDVFEQCGFSVVEMAQPKATGDEKNVAWKDEVKHAPYSIYVLKKTLALQNIKTVTQDQDYFHLDNGLALKEIEASKIMIPANKLPSFSGDRATYSTTKIYLPAGVSLPFHKMKSEETVKHLDGSDITVHLINPDGKYQKVYLGNERDKAVSELVIPAGSWFAEEIEAKNGYACFSATNKPGFHPDDSIVLKSKWDLPASTDLKQLRPLLTRLGSKELVATLSPATAINETEECDPEPRLVV